MKVYSFVAILYRQIEDFVIVNNDFRQLLNLFKLLPALDSMKVAITVLQTMCYMTNRPHKIAKLL